jgi:hypothetical protein
MSTDKHGDSGTKSSATSDGASAAIAAWFGERLPTEWTAVAPEVTVDREEIIVVLAVSAPEAGSPAASSPEAGSPEADSPEAGSPEAGSPEAGSPEAVSDDAARATAAAALAGRIARFREETRQRRMAIAREAEHRFGRKVAWGVQSAGTRQIFTSLAIPVMTRLRQPERLVLDTLVDAGVARSRAHGLAWCVRLVGENAATWLTDLRSAMAEVEKVRDFGPGKSAG